MRRKLLAPLVLTLLVALGVAACGGTKTVTVVAPQPSVNPHSSMVAPKSASPTAIGGHYCSAQNQTQSCALANQPPPPASALKLAPRTATAPWYGIDMAFSAVSPAEAKALGAHFVFSYLSYAPSKNWTLAQWNGMHAEGIATNLNWEWGCCDASQGYSVGQSDAREAAALADQLPGGSKAPITFSVDEDVTWASVAPYFQGVASVLGKNRTGVYGSYQVIQGAWAAGYPSHSLHQTYAWSGGLLSSHACIYQYLNGTTFDNDKSLCKYFGQVPYNTKPPKPRLTGTANFGGAFSTSWAWGVHGVKGSVKGSRGYPHGIAAEGQVGRSHKFRIQGMKATAPPIAGKAIKVYWPVKQLFPFGAHFTFNKGTWDLWGSRGRLPVFPKGCARLSFQIYMATHGSSAFKPEIRKMVCDSKPLG